MRSWLMPWLSLFRSDPLQPKGPNQATVARAQSARPGFTVCQGWLAVPGRHGLPVSHGYVFEAEDVVGSLFGLGGRDHDGALVGPQHL